MHSEGPALAQQQNDLFSKEVSLQQAYNTDGEKTYSTMER